MPTPAPNQNDICNRALRRVRASTIQDFNENSLSAETCRSFWPIVISTMLEMHDWSFANQRVQLAEAGTNDRPFEWLYAYLVPSNCGQPLRVLPDLASAGIAVPMPLPGEPYSETWATLNGYEVPYDVLDGILFTNAQNAWLDYTIDSIEGLLISATCAKAIETELAASLAIPLKGDQAAEQKLIAAKEIDWQRAIAVDRNRQPNSADDYLSETMIARHSGAIGVPFVGEYP